MARQALLWTALPNGYSDDGEFLRVTALLSPRLDAEGDPQELASFPDFVDWPATLAGATFVVSFGGPPPVKIAGNDATSASRVDTTLGGPDTSVWTALFPNATFVEGFEFENLEGKPVLSYPAATIDNLVRNLYSALAASAQDQLPKISDILGTPGWKDLLTAVERNDRAFLNHDLGLRDPHRQFEIFSDGEFNQLPAGTSRNLALLQLFHTPPSTPQIDGYPVSLPDPKARAKWLGYKRTALPAPTDFQKKIDFHQTVAAMNQYRTLMRRLGLAVDLLIAKDKFTPSADAILRVEVELPPSSAGVTRVPDVSPGTRTRLDAKKFQPLPRTGPGTGDYRVLNGLLDLGSKPKVFTLLQSDVDGAGLKVMNFARTLGLLSDGPAKKIDPVTKQEREVGAPSLRNAGLMLVHIQRASMLRNTFTRQKKFNDVAQSIQGGGAGTGPELFAEDVVRGYRIDIWDATTKGWRSLCQRSAVYDINAGEVLINVPSEEGTVRLAATKSADPTSNPDLIWLHEALISWTGWSLCAPPPGKTIHHHREDLSEPGADPKKDHLDEVGEPEAKLPPGLRLETAFKPLPGSLPRLRYGRKYWIRARIVDLSGNSLPAIPKDFGSEKPETNARSYLRYDPISAPALALVKPKPTTVEAPAEGESMERMAIRTFNDVPPKNTVPTTAHVRRFAVAPRTTQREAEQHGMLDKGGVVDPAFFAMLAAKDNSLAEEQLLLAGPIAETPPVKTGFSVMLDGDPLPYLPDPLAVTVAARIFDLPGFSPNKIIPIPLYPAGSQWPDAAPFKIELYENPADAPHFDNARRTLLIPLPKAIRATLRLSVRPTKEALELLGVWNWLTTVQKTALEKMALNGQHWMLTPWRQIELVHATQKPLIKPDIIKHTVDRGLAATFALPNFVVKCSIKSTNHLDLLAQWNEPTEDVAAPAAGANRERNDHAFAVKITEPKGYAGKPDYNLEGNDLIRAGGVFHDLVEQKIHEFNDTRYRRIEYRFEATTRFREFMTPGVLIDPDPTDKNIKVTGATLRTWIPNSAPSPAPEVLYVMPTFGWVRSDDGKGKKGSWRRGGGLRVYLNRPWNVSGYGEMLAVVVPSAAFTDDPMLKPTAQPLKNFVTQWGNDPIWLSPFVAGTAPKRSNFPLARTGPDPTGKWLPSFAPTTEADQPPGPFDTTGLAHPESIAFDAQSLVEIAPHDVFYDDERRLWYCDIEVNWVASYYPFIRLALARYQPVSVTGAHLSNIVLADFMALAPDRWLNVTQTKEPRTRRVSVFGSTFTDSSSHKEAKNAPEGFTDTPGGVVIIKAADVAASSVIEVWGERFEPSLGEDFGWQREPNASVKRDTKPLKKAAVTAKQSARAKKLLQQRKFNSLLKEGIIGKAFVTPTLWEGSVTLPETPGDKTRFRLAIAEYEEYLIDDATAYNPIPTQKDRRLVFIEYVELG